MTKIDYDDYSNIAYTPKRNIPVVPKLSPGTLNLMKGNLSRFSYRFLMHTNLGTASNGQIAQSKVIGRLVEKLIREIVEKKRDAITIEKIEDSRGETQITAISNLYLLTEDELREMLYSAFYDGVLNKE